MSMDIDQVALPSIHQKPVTATWVHFELINDNVLTSAPASYVTTAEHLLMGLSLPVLYVMIA